MGIEWMNPLSPSFDREKIREDILDWLKPEGWNIKILNQPNTYFTCFVSQSKDSGFFVIIENVINRVDIMTKIRFSEEDREWYRLNEDKHKFWLELKPNLMHMGIMTLVTPDLDNLESVELSKTVYFDGLTQNEFFDAIFAVTDALALCNLIWRKFTDSINEQMNKDKKGKES
jgi:hypothetical protein